VLPSGEQIAIAHGDQRVVITQVGATLRTYTKAGLPVVEGFAADELPTGARNQFMYPWPNRVAPTPWTFSGRTAHGIIDDLPTNTHNHGIAKWRPFHIEAVNQNRALLKLLLHATPEYPFVSEVSVAYHLGPMGLTVTTTVVNRDSVPIPFGVGFHPYMAVTTPTIEGASLHVPASSYVETDTRLLPTGLILPVKATPLDFSEPKSLNGHVLDVTYTDLWRDDSGLFTALLRDRDGGEVEMQMDRNFPYLQVFTGDTLEPSRRRTSVAIEPMTCPPEALRSGKDLVVLEPDQQWAGSWRVRRREVVA
jgi:aldose 1-epimerase